MNVWHRQTGSTSIKVKKINNKEDAGACLRAAPRYCVLLIRLLRAMEQVAGQPHRQTGSQTNRQAEGRDKQSKTNKGGTDRTSTKATVGTR